MMDPAMASQPISFEISTGHAGLRKEQLSRGSRAGEGAEGVEGEAQPLLELEVGVGPVEEEELGTPAQRPEPMEGSGPYFCLPPRHHKPCVHVWSRWEDHSWSLQSTNCVRKVAERLNRGLQEVESLQRRPTSGACTQLKQALEELNLLAKQGLRLLRGLRQGNVQEKVALAKKLLVKLRFVAQEPQQSLLDVLVWMLSGRRHVAWARIPAQDVLFSVVEEERGRDCGKIQSLLLTQAPGAAKLELFLGLELGKQAKACTSELPPDLLPEPSAGLPLSLDRDDFSYFQLRAHLYQAQGVLTAGDSGLSDLFARVLISTQCQTTRDELVVFDQLIVDGKREHLQEEPPLVIVNVFDHDKFGPSVFPAGRWLPQGKGPRAAGELIATFELIELDYSSQLEPSVPSDMEPQDLTALVEPLSRCLSLPPHVCPVLREFHVEVLFWGLRGLGHVHLFEVEQPQVVLEVAGRRVESEVLTSYCENSNFTELVRHLTVDLPEQPYLQPPSASCARGFPHCPPYAEIHTPGSGGSPEEEGEEETGDLVPKAPQEQRSRDPFLAEVGIPRRLRKAPLEKLPLGGLLNQGPELEEDIPDPEELDWWSKYYALLQELQGQTNFDEDDMDDAGDSDGGNLLSVDGEAQDQGEAEVKGSVSQKKAIATLKVYNSSLEEEFNHFEDWLNVFPLYRGQGGQDGDGEEEGSGNLVGKFKGSYLIYPESEAVSFSELQISRGIPQNQPIKLLVRVYVVKATNLAPADANSKADPYVVVSAGQEQLDTKERYIPKQLNPIFGEVLELNISLPAEPELTVAVFDHDLVGSDDLIGETHTDLENRFYSHRRANCGLASQYDVDPAPRYQPLSAAQSRGSKMEEQGSGDSKVASEVPEEAQALLVLRRWQETPGLGIQLVPEHVETRPLYHRHSPGLLHLFLCPQGSLHVWIDIFPGDVPPPPPVDVKPRQPVSYELRVIIWNTEDVVLDDANPLTGEMSSDIYVKSWVKGLEHDKQETDVHFNSLTGEGNFNGRFVFRFGYLPTEREVSVRCRPGPLALEEAEFRQPSVLVLQVWDYDCISANDFLGSLELQVPDMVCGRRRTRSGSSGRLRLARRRGGRGGRAGQKTYEFSGSGGNVYILTGKVEAEFELLTVEEAEKRPVGKRRKEPEALEKPKGVGGAVQEAGPEPAGGGSRGASSSFRHHLLPRSRPKTSFNWFVNPLRTSVFFIWRRYWCILQLLAALIPVLLLVFYTRPGLISQVTIRPLHRP
ncbi:hypothetical protein J1605_003221 [Eschrichtius robustus]|uniref:C2 domain-containing protein n=1 Tax=Eschrichtius robustus TaxID=9764 RepID=A0AB34HS52_ESCRO|nr:hypothetical protein J1605_003221 [Eschrichtius robustus]